MSRGELEESRREMRAWLEEACPPEMRLPVLSDQDVCWGGKKEPFTSDAQRIWLERMAEKGWTAPEWPVEYGGAGLGPDEVQVLREEMARIGARPPLSGIGLFMLGPALLAFGSADQKRQYLPSIARGETRWCQGYSEPGAGSDLASLQTFAQLEGDQFRVNGQKVWTSHAHLADWMFCLVRTDRTVPKHQGISFLLIDMTSPGITVRPIALISGASHFCETFFDDVAVPSANLVNGLGGGWDVAKYLLGHERETVAGGAATRGRLKTQQLADAIKALGVAPPWPPNLRARIARQEVESEAIALTMERFRDERAQGVDNPERPALLKYLGTEARKREHELLLDAIGFDAVNGRQQAIVTDWLRSRGNSIEGGTSEIMLKIVGRALELPGA